MSYQLPDPPTPEDIPEPEDIARQAQAEQELASVGMPSRALTAFVVFLTEDGQWLANSNLIGTELEQLPDGRINVKVVGKLPPIEAMELRRPATLQEIGQGCGVVAYDVQNMLVAQMSAQAVVSQAQQAQRQMMSQAEAQAIMSKLNGGGKLFGPGGRPT